MTNNLPQSAPAEHHPISETRDLEPSLKFSKLSPRAIELAETHPAFIEALALGPIATLPTLEHRNYQSTARESIRTNFLAGKTAGLLEIGTGGGKTAIAFNFFHQLPGKVLWLAPSTAALERALDEAENIKLTKKFQVLNGKPVAPDTDILFSTVGMLNYGAKFATINPDEFALIIFDEGHHSMGRATRAMLSHFRAYHLYLTATPEMCAGHLHEFAAPFFRYTSEDLIRQDGFPFWVLRRYEVTGEKISESKLIGDNYALAEGEENQVLNMPHRFAITLQILQRNVPAKEKTIAFLPSVAASRKFVAEIVAQHPELKGQVAHVDGKMDKRVVKAIAKQFRAGHIQAICCNDLFTESLDVPDIRHVLLGDPSRSPRVLLQRIGRGARPSPTKTHLTIHDIVSTVPNLSTTSAPLTVAGTLGTRKYTPDIILNGPQKGKVLFEESAADNTKSVTFIDATTVTTEDISFNERMVDLTFMSNPDFAYQVYQRFAESFDTSIANLILEGETYAKSHPDVELELRYPYRTGESTRTLKITFSDALATTKLYQTHDRLIALLQQDLDHLCQFFHDRALESSRPATALFRSEKPKHPDYTPPHYPALSPILNPTDAVMSIKPLQGRALESYERKMQQLTQDVLDYSEQPATFMEPLRQQGMRAANETHFALLIALDYHFGLAWEGLQDHFRDYRRLALQAEKFEPKSYPFRVRRSEISRGYYFANSTDKEHLSYQKNSNKVYYNPKLAKLGLKTDVNFACHIDKLPHLLVYFDLVVEALARGITVLQFTPDQIMADSANFMLFLGILAGDDSFGCIEPGIPEFWISDDSIEVTDPIRHIAIGIGHLKLDIEKN